LINNQSSEVGMTPRNKGVGRGNGSGGRREGSGRPKGARNRRSAALIAEAEATGAMLPVDYLLSVMRDVTADPNTRAYAASAAAPYCHARLTVLSAHPSPDHLDDAALLTQIKRLERITETPQSDRIVSVTTQVEQMLEELPQLPHRSQESLLRKLVAAGEAGLQRLNDPNRPGAVPRRPDDNQRQPAPAPAERLRRPGSAPASEPVSEQHDPAAPPNGRRLRYDSATGRLEPVS
jgi:hypothetical protein